VVHRTISDRAYSRDEVVDILRSAISAHETEQVRKLQQELAALAGTIDSMRADLGRMRSMEIGHAHIPRAADELDAVVGETAAATGAIMDACEKLEKIAATLDPAPRAALVGLATSVYEACSFQDITGQRLTKVVKTLKNIETRIGDILAIFGPFPGAAQPSENAFASGPQLRGKGITQAEIDRLLSDFGK